MSVLEDVQDLGAWRLESDLASLACQAAIELDNLILDRPTTFDSVRRLIATIAESVPDSARAFSPSSLLDPTAVLVLNRAIGDAVPGVAPNRVDELVRHAARMIQQLSDMIANPEHSRASRLSELKQMRLLCLAVSKHASAAIPSPEERIPDHPFRG
jgi:hypothetical protein